MAKIPVAVLRGGRGLEYDVSLATGAAILAALPAERYEPCDVLITKDGRWHCWGVPTTPQKLARQVAVAVNALHGEFGEDGKVQNLLEVLGLPYTGSGTFASAVGFNKSLAKEVFRRHGLKVPPGVLVRGGDAAAAPAVFRRVSPPWIIKPSSGGSSIGVGLAATYPELVAALAEPGRENQATVVESYLQGREATCGIVEGFRDQTHYALPAIEIRRPPARAWWTYEDKYNGAAAEVCPGAFSVAEKEQLAAAAIAAHQVLGLRHYSRADFIVTPRGVYLLEVNTLPGLTPNSLLPKALESVACSLPDFLDHLINLALRR